MLTELWLSQRYLRTGNKEKIISLTAVISMLGIAIGVLVLIVVISVMSGFDNYLEDKMTGTNSDLFLESYSGFSQPYQLIEKLNNIPLVRASSPFIAGQAFIKTGDKSVVSAELHGIDPVLQPKVSKMGEYIKEGSLNIEGSQVVMGEELALRLGLRLGDTIGLISPVTLKKTDFSLRGIFNSGMYSYDSSLILTSLPAAQDFFKTPPGMVTGISVKTSDVFRAREVKEKIYATLGNTGGYQVLTWEDANRNFLQALKLEKTVMFIVVTMTTVVAAFGIIGALVMSVMNKVKDIGILRSVGANTATVVQVFVYQGLIIGVSGITLGLFGGLGLARYLNKVVDFISGIIGRSLIPRDIYYFDRIPTRINPGDVMTIISCALAITLLASIYPALYASRINPSEALRHE
ncbi:MAG: ABC transporter permease [Candidatus Omnitrophica bacterium]|nr:ABC transporter permease [Candidatus Omnitrophota bacterium]